TYGYGYTGFFRTRTRSGARNEIIPSARRRRGGRSRRGHKGKWRSQGSQGETPQESEITSVYNLSKRSLTAPELSILSKGLSFVPSAPVDVFEWEVDQYKFGRSLRLAEFFGPSPSLNVPGQTALGLKSCFDPISNNASIKTFLQTVNKETSTILRKKFKSVGNLTGLERNAIKSLRSDHSITIRPADKGGGVVVLDYSYYREEILGQLTDTDTYELCHADPTVLFKKIIFEVVANALDRKLIDAQMKEFLIVEYPRVPILYTLPKVHKDGQRPPGRPIVSAVGGLLEPLGQLIDRALKVPVMQLPYCLRDSSDLIEKIESISLPEHTLFITIDVRSLYTIIPHDDGVEAARWVLENTTAVVEWDVEFVIELLRLSLRLNYFRFENKFYRQRRGMSMGAPMAPMYANAFMFLYETKHIVPLFSDGLKAYHRFIDDI
uniref:Reverse transcriptase domain-containing protein n=1 Tax=Leptobrachium leishanense TaxID=445787 RepID=A0A8C5PJT7_9ANUR